MQMQTKDKTEVQVASFVLETIITFIKLIMVLLTQKDTFPLSQKKNNFYQHLYGNFINFYHSNNKRAYTIQERTQNTA